MVAEHETSLRDGLSRLYRPGTELEPGCEVVEVRHPPGEVVLMVRWARDPRLYGIPVRLAETHRDWYYRDLPVASTEEWLDSVEIGLMVRLGTGFRSSARRRLVSDYIELDAQGGWPSDDRFYCGVLPADDPYLPDLLDLPVTRMARTLDTSPVMAARDAGRLLAWVRGHENNASGEPYVGQVVVSWTGERRAHLEHVELADEVPVTVLVELVHLAAHAAGEAGAMAVTTDLQEPELAIAGFVDLDGRREADTGFLDEDPDGFARLVAEDRRRGSRWGQDRDAAGRYLPTTAAGRAWHRLRHGPSGSPPRRFAG